MADFNERVKILRKRLNLTQVNFAKRLGITHGQVSAIELNRSSLNEQNIKLICHEFDVSAEWLRTGSGEMFIRNTSPPNELLNKLKSEERELLQIYDQLYMESREEVIKYAKEKLELQGLRSKKEGGDKIESALYTTEPVPAYEPEIKSKRTLRLDNNISYISDKIIYTPYYGKVAAGRPISFNIPPEAAVPWAQKFIKGDPSKYYTVQVKGNSMTEAGINDGDYVLLRHIEGPIHNKIMLIRHGDESTLKRIKVKNDQEVYMVWEDGKNKEPERLDDQEYEIQGEFIALMRGEEQEANRSKIVI